MNSILFCAFLIFTTLTSHVSSFKRLEELKNKAKYINSLNTTWKASHENVPANITLGAILGFKGIDLDYLIDGQLSIEDTKDIPSEFDTRQNWPECQEITTHVRDQGPCGSCWAVAATSIISDRICIASKGKVKVMISAEDLLSCCGDNCGFGCNGGYPVAAFKYWVKNGLVSGGDNKDKKTCKPYPFAECSHHVKGSRPPCGEAEPTPKCKRSCVNGSDYKKDLYYGAKSYRVTKSVKAIQKEIMKNGPVEAAYILHDDFLLYKSGVYQQTSSSKVLGGHAVKLIGWGVENGVPYWLAMNSWNEEWGDKGLFKFLRGENHCGFESEIVSGIPKF